MTNGVHRADYLPPPLSTRLISREVGGLRKYTAPDEFTEVGLTFSSIDVDRWAMAFLATLETLVATSKARASADGSASVEELHRGFVEVKASLAGTISQSIERVVEPDVGGDRAKAQQEWHQALLRTLESAYDGSTLTPVPLDLVPLRSAPPPPQLLVVETLQEEVVSRIADALTWGVRVTVDRSSADQDALHLSLAFDLPGAAPAGPPAPAALAAAASPAPADLFSALARFAFEHAQLAPFLAEAGSGARPVQALRRLAALSAEVARSWPEWGARQPPSGGPAEAATTGGRDVWSYELHKTAGRGDLRLRRSRPRGGELPPWPQIEGYGEVAGKGEVAVYEPAAGPRPSLLVFSWAGLPLLGVQPVRPSASTERNGNLVAPPQRINPRFVYRTPAVAWPTAVVPFVNVGRIIELSSDRSLEVAIGSMLRELSTPAAGSRTDGIARRLEIESSIVYRYPVADGGVMSELPVLRLAILLEGTEVAKTAREIAGSLAKWREGAEVEEKEAALIFRLTLFSTSPVEGGGRRPLARFAGLMIPIPAGDRGWWGPSG